MSNGNVPSPPPSNGNKTAFDKERFWTAVVRTAIYSAAALAATAGLATAYCESGASGSPAACRVCFGVPTVAGAENQPDS